MFFSVRNIYGPRTVWTLTGVAIRIAEGMGLHRDGDTLGVPPFEAEIRRRIWWQLQMHDFRAAELAGLPKFRGFKLDDHTSKPPANINDNELYPGMSSPAISSTKITDMSFITLRTELANFAGRLGAKFRQQGKDVSQWDDFISRSDPRMKDEFAKEIEEILETKFLRYCDPSQPLQLMIMLIARSSLNITRFLGHHPRRWASQEQTPESERQYVWNVSVSLLEQYDILQSDRRLQGFGWYVAYHLQWHVFIHVLDTLRTRPLMPEVEKAWRLVETTFENNPDVISNTKKPIHVAVGNLCLKAFTARETALTHEGRSISCKSKFITKLRQQRDAAKARRKEQEAKSQGPGVGGEISQVVQTGTRPDPTSKLSMDGFNADEALQNSSFQLTNPNRESERDQPWLPSDLDHGLYGTSGDITDMDTDFMLAQDYDLEDVIGQSISWAQWDAWLGGLNAVQANDSAGSGSVH